MNEEPVNTPQFTPNNSVPNPKKNTSKLLLSILGILIIFFVSFVLYKINNSKVSTNSEKIEEIKKNINPGSDLITYKNSEYGFEIKHPSDWSIKNNAGSIILYGPDADLGSINIKYYPTLSDLPLNSLSKKPYEYFEQYTMDSRLFSNQKNIPLGSGIAKSANLVENPSYKVLLVGGNGHFYEISYITRYDQTLSQLEEIVSTFNFISNDTLSSTASIIEILPSGSIFLQGEGADIPISWKISEDPVNIKTYLRLLSQDGKEVLGAITNSQDCSSGGSASNLSNSVNTFKWDGLFICSNWQAHKVSPGSYRIGVQIYYGNEMIASGNSNSPFTIK